MPANIHTTTPQEIAAWPKSNYTDPPQRTWLLGYSIFWQVLSTVFVAGRLFLRLGNKSGPFGLDDALLIASWVFAFVFTVITCLSVQLGLGRDVWDFLPSNYETAVLYAWLSQVFFLHSTCAVKVSVLLFYRRMAKNSYNRAWLYTVWTFLFITIGSWISFFFAYCLICRPLNSYWRFLWFISTNQEYSCINGSAITIAAGTLTVASDFWSAALPCLMFNRLDLGVSTRQKTALNVVFCIGFLVTAISVVRTYYYWKLGQEDNITANGYNLYAAALTELQLGIICTCAPFLRAFFRHYFPDRTVFTRSNNSSKDRTVRNSRWTVRGSTFKPMKPFASVDDNDLPLEARGEKKGFLVLEDDRLVWRDKQAVGSTEQQQPPPLLPPPQDFSHAQSSSPQPQQQNFSKPHSSRGQQHFQQLQQPPYVHQQDFQQQQQPQQYSNMI